MTPVCRTIVSAVLLVPFFLTACAPQPVPALAAPLPPPMAGLMNKLVAPAPAFAPPAMADTETYPRAAQNPVNASQKSRFPPSPSMSIPRPMPMCAVS